VILLNNNNHTFVVLAYKESEYLEDCIKSVLNQKLKTKVIIGTSTPNDYINNLAKKYNLEVKVNKGKKGIGADFDFAIKCADTELVTIAHQDDIYDFDYAYEIVNAYKENIERDPIIVFPDYYEIKNGKKIYSNTNLRIKRFLLNPLKNTKHSNSRFNKRWVLRFGDAICCPSVTIVKSKVYFPLFDCNLKCNIDWNGWEKLSNIKGSFIFVNKQLMGHSVYVGSTTTALIKDNIRTKEDYEILKRFWPKWIAKIIARGYKNSEKSNNVK
jgi:hypothetical protein